MKWSEILYIALINLSLFTMGASLITIGILAYRRPYRWWAFVLTKLGLFGIVGTILLDVLPKVRELPGNFWTYVYEISVALAGIGASFITSALNRSMGRERAIEKIQLETENQKEVRKSGSW